MVKFSSCSWREISTKQSSSKILAVEFHVPMKEREQLQQVLLFKVLSWQFSQKMCPLEIEIVLFNWIIREKKLLRTFSNKKCLTWTRMLVERCVVELFFEKIISAQTNRSFFCNEKIFKITYIEFSLSENMKSKKSECTFKNRKSSWFSGPINCRKVTGEHWNQQVCSKQKHR